MTQQLEATLPTTTPRDPTSCVPLWPAKASNERRAECLANIQTDVVQLALDLLVREPDIDGFFRRLHEDAGRGGREPQACGVWLIDDDQQGCDFWMAHLGDKVFTAESPEWDDGEVSAPR